MPTDDDIKTAVVDALDSVRDDKTDQTILDSGWVEKVEVSEGKVRIAFQDPGDRPAKERWKLEDAMVDAIEKIEGVTDVSVEPFSGPNTKPVVPPQALAPGDSHTGHDHAGHDHAGHDHGPPKKPAMPASGQGGVPSQQGIEGVGVIIAVASGKGGVGKSTVAVNLALALKKLGYETGLLDVDIYGPSLPTLLGVDGRPKVKDRRILPLQAQGLKVMSLGFLMGEDAPVIWRGPIVTGIIRQFLQDVDWRGTQYLVMDLPPGTGDAQLTLAQSVPIDGAVVVTTPSDLALIDAARGLQMFRTLNVPVLGIVENMSYFICGNCDEKHYIFGQGGGEREARRLEIEMLGQIPLEGKVRAGGDSGHPIVNLDETSDAAKAFMDLARKVVEKRPVPEDGDKKKGLFSFRKS